MMASGRRVAVAGAAVLFFPVLAWAQAATEVGVVSTIEGQATVSRLASTTGIPLKFKDSVFERDRISTAENSTVKVLMGGKAIITIRELSVLTITEELGKTTVNLESGKIAVGVARQRMKPGERSEVQTPNAVAAVRGTVFVVEVKRQGAQLGGGSLSVDTEVVTVHGTVEVGSVANPAQTVLVNAFQSFGITGNNPGRLGNLTPQQMTTVLATFRHVPMRGLNPDSSAGLVAKEHAKAAALDSAAPVSLVGKPPQSQVNNQGGCGGAPCGKPQIVAPPAPVAPPHHFVAPTVPIPPPHHHPVHRPGVPLSL